MAAAERLSDARRALSTVRPTATTTPAGRAGRRTATGAAERPLRRRAERRTATAPRTATTRRAGRRRARAAADGEAPPRFLTPADVPNGHGAPPGGFRPRLSAAAERSNVYLSNSPPRPELAGP